MIACAARMGMGQNRARFAGHSGSEWADLPAKSGYPESGGPALRPVGWVPTLQHWCPLQGFRTQRYIGPASVHPDLRSRACSSAWCVHSECSEHTGRCSSLPDFGPSWNVAPRPSQPIVRLNRDTGQRELVLMRWGLIPFWAKEPSIGLRTITAKAETITTAPAFREANKFRRCLRTVFSLRSR